MRDGTGRTALHWAAVRSEGDTMEAILTFGAKPLVRDNEVCAPPPTPLTPATVNGNTVRSFSTHGQQSAANGSLTCLTL